ncbi:ROK family glucokinase [Mordavella massiliensis]|uniref:Glucokinase n=2 Tax=Mordavella massiliensis TaxID=1871024 RepID=A0A938WZT7_9CLOT|nr:ROK family glucokinase [Mordavella massiliensis]MBM6826711.1 ROK family glucokinase [Mordavella massiliensis]
MKYCFGVDIGGTTVKIGLFTTEGELLEKWEIKTRTENHGEAILPDVAESLQNKMQEKNIRKSEVDGIGIGIPAPVMEDGVVQKTANLGWGYKEVTREMKELTGLPVAAGNDANMAALGEMWLGAGKGQKNMIMVTLGTGVGGGIIVNGKPLAGSHGAGGEIGHFCVNEEETETCGCGNTGCLEQYASATGISRLARRRLERDDSPSPLRGSEISAKAVFDALKEGDAVAKEIVEEFGSYLGHALAAIAVITDPSVIVIGGGVSKAGEILLEYVEKYFHEKAFFANQDTRFVLAQLGNDAGICGAAKLIL